jgi:hypothetical protein
MNVTAITIQLDDDLVEGLRRLAIAQQRSEMDIVREALTVYVRRCRPLPKGMGKYHSGHGDGAEKAREILRDAAKEGRWP